MFKEYAYQFEYDLDDIKNISNKSNYKNKELNYIEIIDCCRQAFIKTITVDKTINAEAFIDNIVNEFNKINQ